MFPNAFSNITMNHCIEPIAHSPSTPHITNAIADFVYHADEDYFAEFFGHLDMEIECNVHTAAPR